MKIKFHQKIGLLYLIQQQMAIIQIVESEIQTKLIVASAMFADLLLICLIFKIKKAHRYFVILATIINSVITVSVMDNCAFSVCQSLISFQLIMILSSVHYLKISVISIIIIVGISTIIEAFPNPYKMSSSILTTLILSFIQYDNLSTLNIETKPHHIQITTQDNAYPKIEDRQCIVLNKDLEIQRIGDNVFSLLQNANIDPDEVLNAIEIISLQKSYAELFNFKKGDKLNQVVQQVVKNSQSVQIFKTSVKILDNYLISINCQENNQIVITFTNVREFVKNIENITIINLMNKLYNSFSHEFGTLLNQIMLNLQIGMESYLDLRQFFKSILNCCVIMQNQIKDIQDFHQLGAKAFQYQISPIDLKDVINELVSVYSTFINQKQLRVLVLNSVEEYFVSDKQRISQILFNLISNAIKFTQPAGAITITIEETQKSIIQFTVQDNGMGISRQTQIKLKQQLDGEIYTNQRLSEEVAGLGIGLINANAIIRQLSIKQGHSFSLQFSSSPEDGTKFWFQLAQFQINETQLNPSRLINQIDKYTYHVQDSNLSSNKSKKSNLRADSSFPKMTQTIFNNYSVSKENLSERDSISIPCLELVMQIPKFMPQTCICKKILLVDDEMFNLIPLQIILKLMGFQADIANSGQEAIDRIDEKENSSQNKGHHCQYRLILMDISMPNLNGFQTAKKILSKYSSIKIVACTAFNDSQTRLQAQESGMVDFLEKPIIKQQLMDKVRLYI